VSRKIKKNLSEKKKSDISRFNPFIAIGIGHCDTKVVEDYSEQNIRDCPVRTE